MPTLRWLLQLWSAGGSALSIEEAQLGDSIQIVGASGATSFAAVHTISHANAEREIEYCYATAGGQNLTAVCKSYVPASCNACDRTYSKSQLKTIRKLHTPQTIAVPWSIPHSRCPICSRLMFA